MILPKNQQNAVARQTHLKPFGFELKPMLDEYYERNLLGGDGLCGPDKSRGEPGDAHWKTND